MPENWFQKFAAQKYVSLSFVKEWLSITDLWKLIVSCSPGQSRYPSFFENHEHNIIQKCLDDIKISDLKKLVRMSLNSEFSSSICQDEKMRAAVLKALTHPEADLEYRLLAMRFLSEHAFAFEYSEYFDETIDPLIFLFYSTTFPAINPEEMALQFREWIAVVEEKMIRLNTLAEDYLQNVIKKATGAKRLECVVFMLSLMAHKLEKEQTQLLVSQLFDLFESALGYYTFDLISDNALRLLSMLVMNYEAVDSVELLKLIGRFAGENANGRAYCAIAEVLPEFPSILEGSKFTNLLLRHEDAAECLVPVWHALSDSQREQLKNTILTSLNQGRFNHVKAAKLLSHALGHRSDPVSYLQHRKRKAEFLENENDRMQLIKAILASLPALPKYHAVIAATAAVSFWHALESDQREEVMNTIFTLLNDSNFGFHMWTAEDQVLIWSTLNDSWREKLKDTLLKLLSSDPDLRIRITAAKTIVLVLRDLNSDQCDMVKKTVLLVLNRQEGLRLEAIEVALSLWEHFNADECQKLRLSALCLLAERERKIRLCDQDQRHAGCHIESVIDERDLAKQVIISCLITSSDEQLSSITPILLRFLNGKNEDIRMKAFDIFMAVICHHPNHEYQLESVENPLLKNYLSHAIKTVRAALLPPTPAPALCSG